MDFCSHSFRSTVLAMALLTFPDLVASHTLGSESGPTPPLKAYFEEVQSLGQDLPNGVGVRGVLDQFKLWSLNSPLTICFNNGDQSLRNVFVETSQRWLPGTSLRFDFGNAPGYRTCSPGGSAAIRVSFNPKDGHWSYIGIDSLKYKDTTLNIGYSKIPADSLQRSALEEIILHEVGHAIGFEHEHQSPESKCEDEFDWPKVYDIAKTKWRWVKTDGSVDKKSVDFNMRVLTSTERLRITTYDRLSIMHYYFDPVLFKRGQTSPCFVGHNRVLSQTDKNLAGEAYPVQVALQDNHLQQRANVASAALAPMKLSAPQLSRVGRALGQVLASTPRTVILDFDLARASGKTLTRGPGDFQVCDSQPLQSANANVMVACEVASDASALLVAVESK